MLRVQTSSPFKFKCQGPRFCVWWHCRHTVGPRQRHWARRRGYSRYGCPIGLCELVNRIELVADRVFLYTADDYKTYIAQMEATVAKLLKERKLSDRQCDVLFRALKTVHRGKAPSCQ